MFAAGKDGKEARMENRYMEKQFKVGLTFIPVFIQTNARQWLRERLGYF
jgi:hypothetical protein